MRASSLLKQTRLDKDLAIEDIATRLKVPKKYLEALENEDKKNFPEEPYCSLIINDYATSLGLNGQNIVCLFRRDFDNRYHSPQKKIHNMSITPQYTFKIGIVLLLIIFVSYLFFEYRKFNKPPSLKVNWPTYTTDSPNIDISGVTNPDATIRVNDDLVIVDDQGNFSKKVKLENLKKITIESRSPNGKKTIVEKNL